MAHCGPRDCHGSSQGPAHQPKADILYSSNAEREVTLIDNCQVESSKIIFGFMHGYTIGDHKF